MIIMHVPESRGIVRSAAFLFSFLFLFTVSIAQAEGQSGENTAGAVFPVRRVVLFSSGVGYFQRSGVVTGNASVELKFAAAGINDLLKSLVVRDADGGTVAAVSYASKEPVTKTLKTFTIDLSGNPSLAEILEQGRGETVEVDADRPIRGRVVGIESKEIPGAEGKPGESRVFLNLLTATGLTRIDLRAISAVRFADAAITRELEGALSLIADSNDADMKTVSISFAGTGRRNVQAGYIREMPVWKTSYRLVLSGSQAPFLQGWALVENTTEEDWSGVSLDLVSGQPISFTMDLYQPLFNPRPDIAYALQPQVTSRAYEGDLGESRAAAAAPSPSPAPPSAPRSMQEMSKSAYAGTDTAAGSVREAAEGESVGEFYRYSVTSPVNLRRGESAMLPILNRDVGGTKYAVYNESVLAKNPLNAFKVKNTTGAPLRGGPVTVYEDGVYAGDAQIDTIEAGGERLLSYSIDLETEVAPRVRSVPETITSVKISRGILYSSRLQRQEKTWVIVNRGVRPRTVLIEHPVNADWTLVKPAKPDETTRSVYRFAVPVDPAKGGREELIVTEERTVRQTAVLSNLDANTVLFYRSQSATSPAVKAALDRLSALRNEYAQSQRQRQDLETRIRDIENEQGRIRANMAALERDSALYRRYTATLDSQEDELASLRTKLADARATEAKKKAAVDDYLAGLEVE